MTHKYGCVYRPQSQSHVERRNGDLRRKLSKCMAQTGLNWLRALPLVLVSLRANVHRTHGLSPFEMHRGQPFPGPMQPMNLDAIHDMDQKSYYDQLKALVCSLHTQAFVDEICEEVWLKKVSPKRRWTEPLWEGPLRVTARTTHAYQLEGKGTKWYHKSHCSPVKPTTGELCPWERYKEDRFNRQSESVVKE